jgi:hypothetical protein
MKLSIHRRIDTAGNPAPIIENGRECHYIGHITKDDDTPIKTAWGETIQDVLNTLTDNGKADEQ